MAMMGTRGMVLGLLGFLTLPACHRRAAVPNAEASARFRAAWDKRRQGDEAGYRALLKEIAGRYPSSRAAQRAREAEAPTGTGASGSLSGAGATAGILAAIAIPAFLKYRERSLGAAGRPPEPMPLGGPAARLPPAGEKAAAGTARGWEPVARPIAKPR